MELYFSSKTFSLLKKENKRFFVFCFCFVLFFFFLSHVFSRPFRRRHRLHVFPRLAPVACFPAFGTSCMFSRALHQLHVFPRLTPVTCFPTEADKPRKLARNSKLSLLASVCFPSLGTSHMFFPALYTRGRPAPFAASYMVGRVTIERTTEQCSQP